jgi:ribA/ribD-fused uncharacterized protein
MLQPLYNIPDLVARRQAGEELDFLFFWGHRPNKDGSISRTCFSQWWQGAFKAHGETFPTAEHYMMYQKAVLFADAESAELVLKADTPDAAKKLGRKVQNFDGAVWNQRKYGLVLEGNLYKFMQNDRLKAYLMSTGDKILVEASPYDQIWGIGMNAEHPDIQNPGLWKGENLLGFALMEARERIKNSDASGFE